MGRFSVVALVIAVTLQGAFAGRAGDRQSVFPIVFYIHSVRKLRGFSDDIDVKTGGKTDHLFPASMFTKVQ